MRRAKRCPQRRKIGGWTRQLGPQPRYFLVHRHNSHVIRMDESPSRLGVVARLTDELHRHVGVADPVLAEFIADLHARAPSYAAFRAALVDAGADFSEQLVAALDRLIVAMQGVEVTYDGAGSSVSTAVVSAERPSGEVVAETLDRKARALSSRLGYA